MKRTEGKTQTRQDKIEGERPRIREAAEPSLDPLHAAEVAALETDETTFQPQLARHVALLSLPSSDAQRASTVLRLQRAYGNSYVQRLLSSMAIQAKMTVSAPGDIYEQEAERVADSVTRAMASQVQRQPEEEEEELQMTPISQLQRQEEEEEELMMKGNEDYAAQPLESLEMRIETARGRGQPLPDTARASLEPMLGHDFGDVRIHTDAEADDLSMQLKAEAFTTGKDIFFRQGAYRPNSLAGQGILAHELAHVVQQSKAPPVAERMKQVNRENSTEGNTEPFSAVQYPVPLIPQPTPDSCWAAAMAMLISYYQGSTTPEQIAETAGISLESSYGWDVLYAAARAYGLREIPPASRTVQGWTDLLTRYGPLWVVEMGDPSHAVVLTGISNGTVLINNPWPPGTGDATPRTFQDFALSFGGAAEAVGDNTQILYQG